MTCKPTDEKKMIVRKFWGKHIHIAKNEGSIEYNKEIRNLQDQNCKRLRKRLTKI